MHSGLDSSHFTRRCLSFVSKIHLYESEGRRLLYRWEINMPVADCRHKRKHTCMWSNRSLISARSFAGLDFWTTALATLDLERRIDCKIYRCWDGDRRTLLLSSSNNSCHIRNQYHNTKIRLDSAAGLQRVSGTIQKNHAAWSTL
jgi:hypothetical protein